MRLRLPLEEIVAYGSEKANMNVLRDAVENAMKRLRVLLDDPDELRRLKKLYNAFKEEANRQAAKEILLADLREVFPDVPRQQKR